MTTTNSRASTCETSEEWIAKAKNILRLVEDAAYHTTEEAKEILLKNADDLQNHIRGENESSNN